jgi:hypothetical protein
LDNNVFFYNQAISYTGALSAGSFAICKMYNSTIAYNSGSRGGAVVYIGGRLDIRLSTMWSFH